MTSISKTKFVILAVLDGWGMAQASAGNAISKANIVNMKRYWSTYPHTQLQASGESVGLPKGEDGNTETGHLNLGAGRIVYQELARINTTIADGTFFKNESLNKAIDHAKENNSALHIMGLVGSGGVHSNIEHLFALLQLAKLKKATRVYLHLFTDGRDSPPTTSKIYIEQIRKAIAKEGIGVIASVMGRYWAMDRDFRWERTQRAYEALTLGKGHLVKTPEEAVEMFYAQGITDEFIEPSLVTDSQGKPVGLVADNDAVIFFNFRIDRPRQLTAAFVFDQFTKENVSFESDPYIDKYKKTHLVEKADGRSSFLFERGASLKNLYFCTMTEYSKFLVPAGAKVAFPPERVQIPLGRVIADAGFRQLRVSESEKERFVTIYFNGLRDQPFEGEERIIVPSPKVSTYDGIPAMSARETTAKLLERAKGGEYPLILINYANSDMVAHTGSIGPTVKACEVVDECVGKLANFVLAYNGTLILTADHGNAEEMINLQTGDVDTEHSTNPVPFIAVSRGLMDKTLTLPFGILADVAPTILGALGLKQPIGMTGRDLLKGVWNK